MVKDYIVIIIMTIVTIIVTREQLRELGTRESEVQRIFAGLRQAVSSKVFFIRLVSLLSSFC